MDWKRKAQAGLTLVEILIAMALMGFVMLSISNFVVKSNVQSASLSMRFKEASEIHALIQDIQTDLHRGAYISPNSFDRRLEYTTYDPATGAAVKKIYVLTATTGGYYLQKATDGGALGSPYRVSDYTKYKLTGTPLFLYAHASNDCWDYVDDSGNGVLGAGDSTQNPIVCSSGPGGSYFGVTGTSRSPSKSSKVILANFNFTTGTGNPEALRSLPQYIFIAVAPGLVRSDTKAADNAAAVKDSMLVQSFSVDSAVNPLWPASFSLIGLTWDSAHERLIIGNDTSGKIFQTERDGVFINTPIPLSYARATPRAVAIEDDGQTLNVLYYDGANDYYYRYNLASGTPLSPSIGPTLFSPAAASENRRQQMAFDPNTRKIYMEAYDTRDSKYKIAEFYAGGTSTPGTETGTTSLVNYWQLPAAFSNLLYLGGLIIDPTTGDFLIARNLVYTSGASNYIDIYRVKRDGTSTSFAINISDLGSSATSTNGVWGMAYDPVLNRLFLADNVSKKVYEVAPPQLISARN